MADLWTLSDTANGGTKVLPALNVVTNSAQLNGSVNASNIINVINDFQWTKNPKSARGDVPAITLIEKKLLINSNVANLANSVFATADSSKAILNGLAAGVAALDKRVKTAAGPGIISNAADVATKAAIETTSSFVNFANRADQKLKNILNSYGASSFNQATLEPYDYLYITTPTGFQYAFPYFDNSYVDNSLNFGGGDASFLGGDVSTIVGGIAAGAAGFVNMLKPGTYIEQSKQFTMGDKGRTINIKFPLLNTGTIDDIQRNWQLLFGLIYQNRPGRRTRSILDMPVIYEVSLPGVVYMPYAFISSLSVKFLGSRRLLTIQAPINGGFSFQTIIPDAYEVNITIEGLNEETKNFLYAAITGGSSSFKVTVGGGTIPTSPRSTDPRSTGPLTLPPQFNDPTGLSNFNLTNPFNLINNNVALNNQPTGPRRNQYGPGLTGRFINGVAENTNLPFTIGPPGSLGSGDRPVMLGRQ